jgi:hypothetical protein
MCTVPLPPGVNPIAVKYIIFFGSSDPGRIRWPENLVLRAENRVLRAENSNKHPVLV